MKSSTSLGETAAGNVGSRSVLQHSHVHNSADAVSRLHDLEGLVDTRQRLAVGDKLVHPELAVEVVLDKAGQLRAALDAAKGAAFPDTAGDELECCLRVAYM